MRIHEIINRWLGVASYIPNRSLTRVATLIRYGFDGVEFGERINKRRPPHPIFMRRPNKRALAVRYLTPAFPRDHAVTEAMLG